MRLLIICIYILAFGQSLNAQAQSIANQSSGLIPGKSASYSVTGLHSLDSDNAAQVSEASAQFSAPILIDKQKRIGFYSRLSHLGFKSDQKMSDQIDMPMELNRVELGIQYAKFYDQGKIWGSRISIGSASDYVFKSEKETIFSGVLFTSRPSSPTSQWIYSLFISNNSPIGNYIPIPGFMYMHRGEKFIGMYGLPFLNLTWLPKKKWRLQTSLFLTNLKVEAFYTIDNATHAYLGALSQQQAFLRANRKDQRERIFYSDKRAYLGVNSLLKKNLTLDFQTGFSFDRRLDEGESIFRSERDASLDGSAYLSLSLSMLGK